MNPPFSNADEHLLKAWDILESGEIVCLLNTETLANPYTKRRQLLASIIGQHGELEPVGQAFLSDAERTAAVDCTIVRLHKTADERSRLHFSFKSATGEPFQDLSEESFRDQVASRDMVGNMMLQYGELKSAFVDYLKAQARMEFYSQGLLDDRSKITDLADLAIKEHTGYGRPVNRAGAFNHFCDDTKQQIWSRVLSVLNIDQYLTHQVQQDFKQYSKQQGYLDFTKENVAELIELIFENRHTILDKAVISVFDQCTQYHAENRCHVKGWKTNDKWKVNRKIIMPYWVTFGEYDTQDYYREYGSRFSESFRRRGQYDDIDKVMCYLAGIPYEQCRTISQALSDTFQYLGQLKPGDKFDNTCGSEFFHIKFFKKGTVHLEFKDVWLWEEFNLRACDGKQWLPEAEQCHARKHTPKGGQPDLNTQLCLL